MTTTKENEPRCVFCKRLRAEHTIAGSVGAICVLAAVYPGLFDAYCVPVAAKVTT